MASDGLQSDHAKVVAAARAPAASARSAPAAAATGAPATLKITSNPSAALGNEHTQRVDVKPGELTRVTLAPPRGHLTVTTFGPAEVFLDGIRIGDAPIADLAIDPGRHELFVKRPGTERRLTITAGDTPTTLNVDFSKP
jgi:hypothetical protein